MKAILAEKAMSLIVGVGGNVGTTSLLGSNPLLGGLVLGVAALAIAAEGFIQKHGEDAARRELEKTLAGLLKQGKTLEQTLALVSAESNLHEKVSRERTATVLRLMRKQHASVHELIDADTQLLVRVGSWIETWCLTTETRMESLADQLDQVAKETGLKLSRIESKVDKAGAHDAAAHADTHEKLGRIELNVAETREMLKELIRKAREQSSIGRAQDTLAHAGDRAVGAVDAGVRVYHDQPVDLSHGGIAANAEELLHASRKRISALETRREAVHSRLAQEEIRVYADHAMLCDGLNRLRDAAEAWRQVLVRDESDLRALVNLGATLTALSDFDAAVVLFERALASGTATELDRAAVKHNWASVLTERGEFIEAQRLVWEAKRVSTKLVTLQDETAKTARDYLIKNCSLLGELALATGNAKRAEWWFREAMCQARILRETSADPVLRRECLDQIATMKANVAARLLEQDVQGELVPEAAKLCAESVSYFRSNRQPLSLAHALGIQAGVFREQRQFDAAIENHTESIALVRGSDNRSSLAAHLNDLAVSYLESPARRVNEAEKSLLEALEINESIRKHEYIVINCNHLAEIYDERGQSESAAAMRKRSEAARAARYRSQDAAIAAFDVVTERFHERDLAGYIPLIMDSIQILRFWNRWHRIVVSFGRLGDGFLLADDAPASLKAAILGDKAKWPAGVLQRARSRHISLRRRCWKIGLRLAQRRGLVSEAEMLRSRLERVRD